jgi:hypothetical protein
VEVRSSTNWRRKDAAAVNHLVAVKSGVGGGGGRRRRRRSASRRVVGSGARRRRRRELVWGNGCGGLRPLRAWAQARGVGAGAGRGGSVLAESSPAHLRSSVGTAHTRGPG